MWLSACHSHLLGSRMVDAAGMLQYYASACNLSKGIGLSMSQVLRVSCIANPCIGLCNPSNKTNDEHKACLIRSHMTHPLATADCNDESDPHDALRIMRRHCSKYHKPPLLRLHNGPHQLEQWTWVSIPGRSRVSSIIKCLYKFLVVLPSDCTRLTNAFEEYQLEVCCSRSFDECCEILSAGHLSSESIQSATSQSSF